MAADNRPIFDQRRPVPMPGLQRAGKAWPDELCRRVSLFLYGANDSENRGPHRKQAATHYLNEFAVLVGKTSLGRKGTAWNANENLFEILDLDWLSNRVIDGFQSGESIIHEVRDPRLIITGKGKTNDPGVTDKRLTMFEENLDDFSQSPPGKATRYRK
jgi:hypothetical protein